MLVSVMLVIEQVGTTYTHISGTSKGPLKLYLLCHSTLHWTLSHVLEQHVVALANMM